MRIPNILTFARFDSYQEILFPDKKSLRQILLQTKKFSDKNFPDNLRQVFGPQSRPEIFLSGKFEPQWLYMHLYRTLINT